MADTVQRVEYFYAQVPNKAGEGACFLTALLEGRGGHREQRVRGVDL